MAEPLYLKISRGLRSGILSGVFRPSDMLPSENDLASAYKTSRVTVRKSLGVLESEGLIRPWHGKGYFVLPPKYSTFTLHFADSMAEGRFQEVNILRPPKEVAELLQLKRGQTAIVTRRVLERGGRAVAYDEKFIPYERGTPSIEFEFHFSEFPNMFESRFAPLSLRTEMTIGMELAPGHVCAALDIPEAAPLLVVARLILTGDDTPAGLQDSKQEGKPAGKPVGTPTGRPVGYGKQYLTEAFGKLSAKSGYEMTGAL